MLSSTWTETYEMNILIPLKTNIHQTQGWETMESTAAAYIVGKLLINSKMFSNSSFMFRMEIRTEN